ncbi:hypothetical protein C7974DRAFT_445930 [Boeremia exigua]|uniref:uncharacterized protein n=1 Tax=Boeremia exigua TaxID=749465 RepID=UPI001E8D2CF2|nr:uncharacterized protein C7974DRAFT_445930 [Boeremia exigua]KAH6612041.1 hypothetical protein C7974DRAFT_445930 [Boeremia exigua]
MADSETQPGNVPGGEVPMAGTTPGAPIPIPPVEGPVTGVATPTSLTGGVRMHPTDKEEWLNSIYVTDDFPGSMTVGEFSKVKEFRSAADSFWQDAHIQWALEIIRRRHAALGDVLIVSSIEASQLWAAGDHPEDISTPAARQDHETQWGPMIERLRSSPFIILPVNDGYNKWAAPEDEATAGVPRKDLPQNQAGYKARLGNGCHWSFIVIDRRDEANPAAHYVDGMVNPQKRKNGTWKIEGIDLNGVIAGKVLCGFDNLLGLEKSKFVAGTLKFVPHMFRTNANKEDYGPCGPHMYAFLDHILLNKTTLIDPGMPTTFNENDRAARATALGFDSAAIRAKFADELMQERRQREILNPNFSVDNLTPDVLRSLMTVDGLIDLVQRSSRPESVDQIDDEDDDGQWGDPPVDKSTLREVIANDPEVYADILDREQRYQLAHETLVTRQRLEDERRRQEEEQRLKSANVTDLHLGMHVYRNVPLDDTSIWPAVETSKSSYPAGRKNLPDFTKTDPPQTTLWLNKSTEIDIDRKQKGWRIRASAMLHLKFYKSFLGETDAKLTNFWANDVTVFDPSNETVIKMKEIKDARVRCGMMRLMMMEHYQGKAAVKALLKTLKKYRVKASGAKKPTKPKNPSPKGDDESSGDESGDGDDGKGGEKQKDSTGQSNNTNAGQGQEGPQNRTTQNNNSSSNAGQTTDNRHGINNNSTNSIANPSSGAGSKAVTPGPGLKGLLDFRTMSPTDLQAHMTTEMRTDPRIMGFERDGVRVEPSIVSMRALCLVQLAGASFSDETYANCTNLWLLDPLVFTNEERERSWEDSEMLTIVSRMNEHYGVRALPTGPPTDDPGYSNGFSDSEEEIEEGTITDNPTTSGTKRKNPEALTGPAKKVKLDDRNFLKMAVEDLALWIKKMPLIFRNRLPTVLNTLHERHARIWLERMYGEGFEYMRNEEPLSEASIRKLRQWGFASPAGSLLTKTDDGRRNLLRSLLTNPLIQGRLVPIPDRREELRQEMEGGEGANPGGQPETGSGSSTNANSPSNPNSGASNPPGSENGSDSEDGHGGSAGGTKRARDPDDTTGNKSKKPKTLHLATPVGVTVESLTQLGAPRHSPPPNPNKPDETSDPANPEVPGNSSDPKKEKDDDVNNSFGTDDTEAIAVREVHIGERTYVISEEDNNVFLPWDTTGTSWPSGITNLPDFTTISADEIELWLTANPEIRDNLATNNEPASLEAFRAALHMKFKRTFMHEPDEVFTTVWLRDNTVFNAEAMHEMSELGDATARNGAIRERMMRAYEPELLRKLETSEIYRPESPRAPSVEIEIINASTSTVVPDVPEKDRTKLGPMTQREAQAAWRLENREQKARERKEREKREQEEAEAARQQEEAVRQREEAAEREAAEREAAVRAAAEQEAAEQEAARLKQAKLEDNRRRKKELEEERKRQVREGEVRRGGRSKTPAAKYKE